MKKPKKDDYVEDDSLTYLQGTATGVYSFTVWSEYDRTDPESAKKEKKKKPIGFINTNKKKKEP